MKKQMSEHARAAKAIRAICKEMGLKARVKSSSYSMGSSVRVVLENPKQGQQEELEGNISKYQYGHFDGMVDMYELSNYRDDIPQVKFVQVSARYSNEIKQAAWDHVRNIYAEAEEAPELYEDAGRWRASNGLDGYSFTMRVIRRGELGFTY